LKKISFKCFGPFNRLIYFFVLSITIILTGASPCRAETDFNLIEVKDRVPALYFETNQKDISIDQLTSPDFRSQFEPVQSRKTLTPGKIQWFFLDFSDIDLSLSDDWILSFPNYDEITLYFSGDTALETRFSGKLRKEKVKGLDNSSNIPFQEIDLIDDYYLLARVEHSSRKYRLRAPDYMHPVASKF
jgi:hypothetical protein